MSLDSRYIRQRLKEKGFKIDEKNDHYYCRFYICGEIMTKISSKVGGHSKSKYKTLGDDLVLRIYKRLHFDNKKQFLDFLDCPFELEDYQKMLFKKKLIKSLC